jgi:ribose transport system substrate-binding protein
MNRGLRLTVIGMAGLLALGLPACSKPSSSTTTTTSAGSAGAAGSSSGKQLRIGFFGFAKANSFTQAGWAGVQETAAKNNATATFVDSNFDAAAQVNALQDAVTAKRFDVVIIQANDGTAVVNPVKQAIAAGIKVVVQFTPVGGRYDTIQPQVPGTINIIDPPTVNGVGLAKLGIEACKSKNVQPADCKVAYLQGFANYPLDAARTKAAVDALKAGGVKEVISNLVGGYTQDTGRAAMQNLLQAHPDVNVVIGSSQALEGATPLASGKKIAFVGNGGSTQAADFVKKGTWYGTYLLPEKTEGAKAAELGIKAARGESVPNATNTCDLTPYACLGTASTLKDVTGEYSD